MNFQPKVFISYSSYQVNIVRQAVEFLMLNEISVWFAEYSVLSADYDDFNVNLDNEIKSAINSCTHAILFTSQKWKDSKHCQLEFKHIMTKMSLNLNNVINIKLDNSTNFLEAQPYNLKQVNYYDPNISQSKNLLFNELSDWLGFGIDFKLPHSVIKSDKYWLDCKGFKLGLLLDGFGLNHLPLEYLEPDENGASTRYYHGEMFGRKVKLFLTYRPDSTIYSKSSLYKSERLL